MFNARNTLDKSISVGGRNNMGVGPQTMGGSKAQFPTLRRFYSFFFKKYTFLGIFALIFCLKTLC